ncbi:NAD-dependent epimerase/dehydratase [Burkholderia sp. H160]|nr:NAD-dependent epimerase/dehydratase [Burkholderia sp. H160]
MNNTRIILPGGAGLVGQNLVARLKQRGYTNLVVLDKHRANLDVLRGVHPDITIEYADLAEPGEWTRYFDGAEVVVMLQAQIGGPTIEPFIRNNITSTELVLDAIKRYDVPYTIHISSSVVNSVAKDFYTDTKRKQEEIVLASGVECVVLRPTLMFGWFDRKHLGWLSRFMQRVPVFPIPGSGRFMRQPLYAGDFCNVIISCIESRKSGQAFNISGREKVDYIDIIRQIKRATRARCAIIRIPYALFYVLLKIYALFDKNPPFTAAQLKALTAGDEFEVIDWEGIFGIKATSFANAVDETFNDPVYSQIALEF